MKKNIAKTAKGGLFFHFILTIQEAQNGIGIVAQIPIIYFVWQTFQKES